MLVEGTMGSWQLVTAAVVALTLGPVWLVGADTPQTEEKKKAAQKGKAPTGPTNSAPSQDKLPADTPGGLPSKEPKVGGASGRIPGTGGAAKAQDPNATTTAPMPAANTLFDPSKDKPQGNTPPGTKVVTPDSFKSKEERLNELANPGTPAPESGGGATKKALERSGSDVMGGVSTTVAPGAGKNAATTREQQSEVKGDVKREGSTGVVTLSGNRGEASWTIGKDGKLTNETIKVRDKDTTVQIFKDYEKKTTSTWVEFHTGDYAGQVWTQHNNGTWVRFKTPNPETDTGDGHGPKAIAKEPPKKSPSEVEAERRRQVTQPTDDQRRQFERMKMNADVALKSAMAKRTDGRIDPGREGTTGRGGFTGPIVDTRPRGVDGLPKTPPKGPGDFGRPVTQPRGGGTTPDNPTASGGTGQTTTESEPPRR